MDLSESLAENFLRSVGFDDVVYEPDGNVPPDFLVDQRIAVEVRRLNQLHESSEGDKEPLEKVSEPIAERIQKYLESLGPPRAGESWLVHISFSRPLESWRTVRRELERSLDSFKSSQVRTPCTLRITPHLELELKRARTPQRRFLLLGGSFDHDSGGFTLAETIRSLKSIIPEKASKVAPYKDRYPEWWLVLINHIGYRLNEDDLRKLRESPPVVHSFDRVVLVNPLDTSDGTEI